MSENVNDLLRTLGEEVPAKLAIFSLTGSVEVPVGSTVGEAKEIIEEELELEEKIKLVADGVILEDDVVITKDMVIFVSGSKENG